MTVWPSGLRRWLQAPVRKGVGSNPTAVSSLQQSCVAVCPTTKQNQHFCQNVAYVVLSTSTRHNVKSKLPSTNRGRKRFSGRRFLCSAHSRPIQMLRRKYAWPEGENMTVWPSGLRRWLQAPVRKGVGSNPTAVSSLQQSCVAVSPTTELNQYSCQNVAHVVLSTSTQHNVNFKFPSTNRKKTTLFGSSILMFCTFPSYPTSTTIICFA